MKKKLAIYVHSDSKGKVRDYVIYCLQELQRVVSDILFVMNGMLSAESMKKLEALGIDVLVRNNTNYDFGGWKAGIEYYGYDKIAEYDELLLTNGSYYGPIYPFSEMWEEMDKRECDFWGINRHPDKELYTIPGNKDTRYIEHIQSYWLVFRKKLLESEIFKNYWMNLRQLKNYQELLGYGEMKLTQYFEKEGFVSAVYMDFEKYKKLIDRNPTFLSDIQVIEDRCPIIKRKYFSGFKDFILNYCSDYGPRRLLRFLEEHKLYRTDMIWDDLLANQNMSELNDSLHLNYILSSDLSYGDTNKIKAAVIMYIYPADLVSYCYNYAVNVPEYIDIIVVNTDKKVAGICKNYFSNLPNRVEYRQQQNRGRDNTALLITCRDIIEKYDYICFVHAKKSPYFNSVMISDDFRNHNFISLLYSHSYIENILHTFQNNMRLGLLVPFTISTNTIDLIGREWTRNYKVSEEFIHNILKLDIKLDPHVMAPLGGMYWFRGKALKSLFDYPWKFEDFPEEPLSAKDGMLTHIIERITPLLVQYDGYYTAWVAPDSYAEVYLGNLYYKCRKNVCRNLHVSIAQAQEINLQDIFNYAKNKIRYCRYKVLSKITIGKKRQKYKHKRKELKSKLKYIKNFIKENKCR